jgi:hypothetical protein
MRESVSQLLLCLATTIIASQSTFFFARLLYEVKQTVACLVFILGLLASPSSPHLLLFLYFTFPIETELASYKVDHSKAVTLTADQVAERTEKKANAVHLKEFYHN